MGFWDSLSIYQRRACWEFIFLCLKATSREYLLYSLYVIPTGIIPSILYHKVTLFWISGLSLMCWQEHAFPPTHALNSLLQQSSFSTILKDIQSSMNDCMCKPNYKIWKVTHFLPSAFLQTKNRIASQTKRKN